jgi:hypothetical protein
MPTFTEAQMREAIEGEIKTAAPLAVVFPFWALGWDERQWPGLLNSPSDSNRVHGYVITRRRTYAEREQPNCVRRFFTYQIRGLRWYDDAGTRAANSDLIYNAELDTICARFANRTTLPRSINRIAENSELDFTVDLNLFGAQLLHRAVGSITIEQC